MPDTTEAVLEQALRLPGLDRARIAERLIASLDAEPVDVEAEAAWQEEVARRLDRIGKGETECLPWDVVRDRIRGKLRGQA